MATNKPKKKTKGRRHPAHAASFAHIADDLKKQLGEPDLPDVQLTPEGAVRMVIAACEREAARVRTIVR